MEIRTIGVVGSGTMGNGIAHVAAQFGFTVLLNDLEERFLARAQETIGKNLQRGVDKGKMTAAEREGVLSRIRATTRFADLAAADLVVEAVVENLATKQDIFRRLDELTRPEALLATNTSSISITKIGAATKRPDRVIGMHFMNPVPVMKLVEVIRGLETSDATCADVITLSQRLGKTPVEVNDSPGFVSNRVLLPLINEAVFALAEGVGTPQAIDTVMKLGMNHPMGPLELADFIGLDVCLDIMGVLHEGFGDPKYRACPLLRKMVDAGRLGRKSGRGFYRYDEPAT
jgi:3-hydroxybutyryl-CoA dehydrogenase